MTPLSHVVQRDEHIRANVQTQQSVEAYSAHEERDSDTCTLQSLSADESDMSLLEFESDTEHPPVSTPDPDLPSNRPESPTPQGATQPNLSQLAQPPAHSDIVPQVEESPVGSLDLCSQIKPPLCRTCQQDDQCQVNALSLSARLGYLPLHVGSQKIEALVDTGASGNVISEELLQTLLPDQQRVKKTRKPASPSKQKDEGRKWATGPNHRYSWDYLHHLYQSIHRILFRVAKTSHNLEDFVHTTFSDGPFSPTMTWQ